MNFYRTAVYLCLGLIIFNFCLIFVGSLGAFETGDVDTIEGVTEDTILAELTDLDTETGDDPSWSWFWGTLIAGGAAGLAIGFLTKQSSYSGAIIFGSVFWASYFKMYTIIDVGGWLSTELPGLLIIFTVATGFLFIAAVIGMFTGSG